MDTERKHIETAEQRLPTAWYEKIVTASVTSLRGRVRTAAVIALYSGLYHLNYQDRLPIDIPYNYLISLEVFSLGYFADYISTAVMYEDGLIQTGRLTESNRLLRNIKTSKEFILNPTRNLVFLLEAFASVINPGVGIPLGIIHTLAALNNVRQRHGVIIAEEIAQSRTT